MAELRIFVDGTRAVIRRPLDLTAGMVGVTAVFEFSCHWSGLLKTAVFRTDDVAKDVLVRGNRAVIPAEVLAVPGKKLYIGVYGTSTDGSLAIPTRWVCVDRIYSGANPSGDTTTDPALPVWAQLRGQIGDLDRLQTANRESLVEAINALARTGGGGAVTEEAVRSAVADYLKEHPQEASYVRAGAEAVAEKIIGITGEASTEGGYINQIPLSIDTDGSVYNGTGYREGTRLNSSGAVKEITESYFDASVCTTGFIPCKMGDRIHLQGLVIDPADEQAGSYNVHVYDSGFAVAATSSWKNLSIESEITTGVDGCVTLITLSEGTTLGAPTCAYIRLSARGIDGESVVTVNQAITEGTVTVDSSTVPFTFGFLTDLHWYEPDAARYQAAAQAVRIVGETAPLDLVVFGGDYTFNWTEESAENARRDIAACRKTFSGLPAPALWLRGNHENNGYIGQRLSRQEIFNRVSRSQNTLSGYVTNPTDPYGCYGYLDFENAKVRVMAVNTSDNDQMGTAETQPGNAAGLINCHNIGAAQLQWIADRGLDLSDKEDPQGWMIIVVSHIPVYSSNSWYNSHSYTDGNGCTWTCNVSNLQTLMAAYRDGGSFAVELNGESAGKDFGGTVPAGKILFVNGHGHCLKHVVNQGFTYLTCPNTCNNGENQSDDGTTYKKTEAGTLKETVVTFLTVDRANSQVYAWAYGAGYDRTVGF